MSNMNYRIAHISSAHPRYDVRIFHKEVCSLAKKEGVFLIVADGLGDENINNISIQDVGKFGSRFKRMFFSIFLVLFKVLKSGAKVVHFHDPELLLITIPLKFLGKIVVYDVHENVHMQILSKTYIHSYLRYFLSRSLYFFENIMCTQINSIVCATPSIASRFHYFKKKVFVVNNYPLSNELYGEMVSKESNNEIAYIGAISEERGIFELISAINILNGKVKLNLAGNFSDDNLFNMVSKLDGWKYVKYYGQVSRTEVKSILSRSSGGIVNFLPAPNHMEAQPNKMFEYMSAGLPLLCSNFPLWNQIISTHNCGISFDPTDPISMAESINKLFKDIEHCKLLGVNGRKAVNEFYNWDIEEQVLFHVYDVLKISA
jgi:glycosyltransferase involved in cell wall biosynthesis